MEVLAIEGPAWMVAGLGAQLEDPERRARLLRALERVEARPEPARRQRAPARGGRR